jgi:hypothetical protein
MELPRHLLKPDAKTLRQFAWGWVIFFGALAIVKFAIQHRMQPAMWLGITAVVGVLLNLLVPVVFRWIFVVWMVLAYPIGWVVSQVALALMFYCIITPVALIFRVTGRDRLRRFKPANATTYWIAKKMPDDVRRYFRQY